MNAVRIKLLALLVVVKATAGLGLLYVSCVSRVPVHLRSKFSTVQKQYGVDGNVPFDFVVLSLKYVHDSMLIIRTYVCL